MTKSCLYSPVNEDDKMDDGRQYSSADKRPDSNPNYSAYTASAQLDSVR